MDTYWPKIRELEQELKAGNADRLIAFIGYLARKNLLDEHMFHAICSTTFNPTPKWEALHEFAKGLEE